ncbi:hypothetical protein HDIA_1578 [Hartmannibacter diazotrophicus]|uniref:Uncharacterized protein n=1 Tax=Hartmannibacter diazotrophicus TaxID=1482074 RepID=A0A2C9D4L9_9HYPH|nr:hypothetical protein [Hartmannibacter diazotrophicus]SON55119.1 hypothetical protein HDIA_1578 [Hartmannibacter diazotrophicus]
MTSIDLPPHRETSLVMDAVKRRLDMISVMAIRVGVLVLCFLFWREAFAFFLG